MTRCPSELDLERHLRAPLPAVAAHLEACDRCRAREAWAREAEATFRREVFPATVDAVVEATRPRRARWALLLVPALAAAAAVVVVLPERAVQPARELEPPPGYVGPKGGLALAVYADQPGGARAVPDAAAVAATAGLRFEVRPPRPCHLWLASLDAAGQVSRLHPAAGGPVLVDGDVVLPGGAVLDGRPGPERLYAVCTPEPVAFDAVAAAVRAAAAEGRADPEASVRAARELGGLPKGSLVTTVLLEKRPAAP
ncbi:MAG: DUF4384 domain-containing protein [Anaeromyxobacter sp.]